MPPSVCAQSAATGAPGAGNRIDLIRPDAPELAAFGPHPVGVRSLRFTHPGQNDIVNTTDMSEPLYDRPLTVEVWYPAAEGTGFGGSYQTLLRDGRTKVTLLGRAVRDAAPASTAAFPLLIISHGYPGNRFLLSHLGENLASKGYVAAAIDHAESTYADQGPFGSSLLHRPLDQRFVIDRLASVGGPLSDITDAEATAIIGFSVGGYGALVFGGAGVTEAATEFDWAPPRRLLRRHMAGTESHAAQIDDRVKAVIAIGPWGMNAKIWDRAGLAGLQKPLLLMAGEVDDVSIYTAIREIFAGSTGVTRHLLTFEAANHNAAAPIPAPAESWAPVDNLDFVPFEHYADAVWDSTRMNNIAQHFATAFLDLNLKGHGEKAAYLDLIERAADGVVAQDDAGRPTADHSYWRGFPARTAQGLRFETLAAGSER